MAEELTFHKIKPSGGAAVTIMAFGGMVLKAISDIMSQNTAYRGNPAILADQRNRSYLADNNIYAAKFGNTVIVMPLDQVSRETMAEALRLNVAEVEVEAVDVQDISFNPVSQSEMFQIAKEIDTAALLKKTVELLDPDVKTEVAAQVVEKALENNITVDGLEAFMTEELDGVLSGVVTAAQMDGADRNSSAE